MNHADIREIFEYNYWANKLLLTHAEKVTAEQFVAPSTHSFSTLQATLVHILDTEYGWRDLLKGRMGIPILEPEQFPTVAALRDYWQTDEEKMWEYINGLSDKDMVGTIEYVTEEGLQRKRVLWHCLYHVVNHGMQHRSEAAELLTRYGQSPGDLDFTVYLNWKNSR
jgi:uncharacterized damage-inducible protein DinB